MFLLVKTIISTTNQQTIVGSILDTSSKDPNKINCKKRKKCVRWFRMEMFWLLCLFSSLAQVSCIKHYEVQFPVLFDINICLTSSFKFVRQHKLISATFQILLSMCMWSVLENWDGYCGGGCVNKRVAGYFKVSFTKSYYIFVFDLRDGTVSKLSTLYKGDTPLNNPPIEIHANSSMFALIFWPHVTIFCIF